MLKFLIEEFSMNWPVFFFFMIYTVIFVNIRLDNIRRDNDENDEN